MEYLGWVGNIFIVTGLWLIGSKNRKAFYFSVLGEALWVIKSLYADQYDLAVICCVFAVLAVRSYISWGKE
jgi:hypothetical protein